MKDGHEQELSQNTTISASISEVSYGGHSCKGSIRFSLYLFFDNKKNILLSISKRKN